jgi:D-beta-D-heptose 7-phosphate kinase / D-beta-D-heptose 1-phosphate adenosyltransferase
MNHLMQALDRLGSPLIAVLGDYMLDGYVYGDVERISPEAPVPVLKVLRREDRPGGAANVVSSVLAMGGRAACVGVAGRDSAGGALSRLLAEAGADTAGLLQFPERSTTVKSRHVGLAQHRHQQQILRVDDETAQPLPPARQEELRRALAREIERCDLIAIEDYDKGAITDESGPALIAMARKAGKKVLVDPAGISNYERYAGATLLTPNRYEAQAASGVRLVDDASLEKAAGRLADRTGAEAVVIKLDKEGAFLFEGGRGRRVPTRPRDVYDVTGAGDVVLAMLATALASGCSFDTATGLANVAGGLEVEHFGVVPIYRDEVRAELQRALGLRAGKVMDRDRLAEEVRRRRSRGEAIVFTNGCFDLLHMGHVRYLRQARQLGGCLIVAINTDKSVARLKGPMRPVIGQDERAEMLAALECVDYVTLFDEDTPHALLSLFRPDLLVKGGSTPVVVGREVVEGYGGRVATLELAEGLSTTRIIERILSSKNGR